MVELIWQAQSGNKEAMSKIIDDNIGLVWNIVKRFSNRGHDIEDLFQIGCLGFLKAIYRFNTDYEVQLSTYAVPMIIGEIKRFLRDDGMIKVSRSIKELVLKIRNIQEEEIRNGKEEIGICELAEKLDVSKEDIVVALESMSYIESLDKKISDDDDTAFIDKISIENNEYNNIINKITVSKVLERLDEREKKVILFRYFKEKTQTEISKILGMTQVQVSRLEKRALEKMRIGI
jgi:RNA polymerase sporulation-specific sigma factor